MQINYFFMRWDLVYFMREAYQSGGLFWPVVRPLTSRSPLLRLQCSHQPASAHMLQDNCGRLST